MKIANPQVHEQAPRGMDSNADNPSFVPKTSPPKFPRGVVLVAKNAVDDPHPHVLEMFR